MNNTKERPIVLTVQEVNAVLAGDKTQHRVPIENNEDTAILFNGSDWRYDGLEFKEDGCCAPNPQGEHYMERLEPEEGEVHQYTEEYESIGRCPFGAIGDRLWVQEQYRPIESLSASEIRLEYVGGKEIVVKYKNLEDIGASANDDYVSNISKWRNAETMPRWASRILLEITDIRIERIKDISEADAKAMGLKPYYCDHKYQTCEDIGCIGIWASALFLHLRHERKLAVHYTDWVWVVEYKVVEPSEVQGG